ncbi:hypothetical protein A2368_02285 [Candidatus Collierbacteria bacterium RIFOXYB1_FULL_49_13]|uniref:DUF2568 domain-containing protein n=1 Tax=Candidatus Collierbacteria bacterium RIFOXYB1_FULL_49_13 TaxID=1817728 RepID=A0A1F5FIS8_9BACT|nr:MAG: hypothetical protein A2368_02285 [Candidatus Collierbacteria bacterium RIFOXYB1_FULL_49_13]
MSLLIGLAVRITVLIALWVAWGWTALLIAIVLLAISNVRTKYGDWDLDNPAIWVRVAIEFGVLVLGLIAANTVWGAPWAAAILIIYVIGAVAR